MLGCSDSKKYPIESVHVDVSYYLTALHEVNEQLESNPSNIALRKRKLLVSRELRWPEDVLEDILFLKREDGLTYELVQNAIDFYQTYHFYEPLLDVLEEWESINGALRNGDKWRIVAYLGLGRYPEAKNVLWDYIQNSGADVEALFFAGDHYLSLGDTARALYAYGKVAEWQPDNTRLLEYYVPALIKLGYSERVNNLMAHLVLDSSNVDEKLAIAKVFYEMGVSERAHQLLAGDETASVLLTRIRWHEASQEWDEAINLINSLLANDSSSSVLLRKAQLLEERGWLSSSYSLYRLVHEQDSSNSIAAEGVQNVGRKIAYLRSLREEQGN